MGERWNSQATSLYSTRKLKMPVLNEDARVRILSITDVPIKVEPEIVSRLFEYLALVIDDIIIHAPTRPPVLREQFEEIRRLHLHFEASLKRLHTASERLRDSADPPPRVDMQAMEEICAARDWDNWFKRLRNLNRIVAGQGRPSSSNSDAAIEFLAVYHRMFDRNPSGSSSSEGLDPPALRFIEACMDTAKEQASPKGALIPSPWFATPTPASLKKWLSTPGQKGLPRARHRLELFLKRPVNGE